MPSWCARPPSPPLRFDKRRPRRRLLLPPPPAEGCPGATFILSLLKTPALPFGRTECVFLSVSALASVQDFRRAVSLHTVAQCAENSPLLDSLVNDLRPLQAPGTEPRGRPAEERGRLRTNTMLQRNAAQRKPKNIRFRTEVTTGGWQGKSAMASVPIPG